MVKGYERHKPKFKIVDPYLRGKGTTNYIFDIEKFTYTSK